MLELVQLGAGDRVIDLGCAFARVAFVMALHFRKSEFLGFEICADRVREARRVWQEFTKCLPADNDVFERASSLNIVEQDLASEGWILPSATVYFIYDFGSEIDVRRVLEKLRLAAGNPGAEGDFLVISRGRRVHQLIYQSHAWLGENVVHRNLHFTIFRSR